MTELKSKNAFFGLSGFLVLYKNFKIYAVSGLLLDVSCVQLKEFEFFFWTKNQDFYDIYKSKRKSKRKNPEKNSGKN